MPIAILSRTCVEIEGKNTHEAYQSKNPQASSLTTLDVAKTSVSDDKRSFAIVSFEQDSKVLPHLL